MLLGLNWIRFSRHIAAAPPITSVSLRVAKDTATLVFTWSCKFKLYESYQNSHKKMERLEITSADMHLCNVGSDLACGIQGSNDGFVEGMSNTEAFQRQPTLPQNEYCAENEIQLENSSSKSSHGNTIFLIISHAESSVELEYAGKLKREDTVKLPEGNVVITARSEQHMTFDHECFNIDLYMSNLSTSQLGKFLIWSPCLPSTHTLLSQNFHTFPCGSACVADIQFQGKGRSNNLWESPLGCMMFSFTLVMDNGRVLPLLQYVVSLAVIEAIEIVCEAKHVSSPNVKIKWPNDIYANGLKVGGILCTSTYSSKRFNVTIGIGLNLDNEKPTTCLNTLLRELSNHSTLLRREELLAAFFGRFEALFDVFLKDGFPSLEGKYYEKWLHSGQKVLLDERQEQSLSPSNVLVTIEGLTSSGYLLAIDDKNNKYELHPNGNSFDFFKGLVRKKFEE